MTAVAAGATGASVTAGADLSRPRASRLAWLRERGMGASILVAALSAAFGVILVETTVYIGAFLQADPYIGDSETLAIVVAILSVLLTGVAMYVAAIVTANTFSTIIAGRTRRIALVRLIGASARSQRSEVSSQGFVVGLLGATIGLVIGVGASATGMLLADQLLAGAPEGVSLMQPAVLLPFIGVALTTWLAAWVGSRRVLTVTPLQALGGSVERAHDEVSSRTGRHVGALILLILGAALLAFGVMLGLVTPLGVVVAFFGGLLSFTGLALGSVMVMPPILRLVGRAFGRSATARLAAENALRYPERSSRMAIGVVMGVTLVTMFAVALESTKMLLGRQADEQTLQTTFAVLDGFAAVMMVLVAVSGVIAAVGLVNLLTIGVVQRTRELGLLRAIGLTGGQVRRMVLLEAVHVTVAATISGLVLGIVYGWVAAQSLLGSVPVLPDFEPAGLVSPAVPWMPVAIIVAATAVLALVAAVAPTRLATRVAPVEALAAE
ncbi:FtsX-like permease family protein [Microbacterium esteraromaticum]|uniref:ABC transporter permease n=1 Tax=Microbacterium esteraromaticum TaxID=57043 RepID=UPI003C2E9E07